MTKIRGTPAQGLAGATLAFFVGLASVALFGPTAKGLNELLALDGPTLGLLIGIPSLTGALLRVPFGAWVDKTGGKLPNLLLLGLSLLGMLGLSLSISQPSLLSLAFFGALAGCGVATFSVSAAQVSYWYPKRRQGTAIGIYGGVANTSPGIASFLIPLALVSLGAQGTYFLWVGLLAAGTLIYLLIGRNSPYFQFRKAGLSEAEARDRAAALGQELFPSGSVFESLKTSASYAGTWVLVGIYFTTFGGFLALTAWFPTYWQVVHGFRLFPDAVALTALFSVGASIVRVLAGFVTDRLGGEKTSVISLGLTALGAGLAVFGSSSFVLMLSAVLLLLIGMGANNAATFKILPSLVPGALGGASGWVGGLGALGGFVFPILQGLFIANPSAADPGYSLSFLVYAIAALLSLGLLLFLSRKSTAKKEAHK